MNAIDTESTKVILDTLKTQDLDRELRDDYNPDLGEEMLAHYKMKQEMKNVTTMSKIMFLECLKNHPDTWPSLPDSEAELKKSSSELSEIKSDIEREKTTIQGLTETTDEALSILEGNLKDLEERIQSITVQRLELEKKKQVYEKSCQQQEKKRNLELHITKLEEAGNSLQMKFDKMECILIQQKSKNDSIFRTLQELTQDKQTLDNCFSQSISIYDSIANLLLKLGDIREHPVDSSSEMQLEFIDSSGNNQSLFLTLAFTGDKRYSSSLRGAEISGSSLTADDLISAAMANNDIPTLIFKLKQRWLSFLPLLSAITEVMESNAVDWIQEKGLLRVLLGKRAVMCTLHIPPGYPLTGQIALIDMQGTLSDHSCADLKPSNPNCSLKDWLLYLEDWINTQDAV